MLYFLILYNLNYIEWWIAYHISYYTFIFTFFCVIFKCILHTFIRYQVFVSNTNIYMKQLTKAQLVERGTTCITHSEYIRFKAIDRVPISWKSHLSDKIKQNFFQTVSIQLYECTTWTLTKRIEKRLDGNYTRTLRAILNKYRKQHTTK